MSARNPIEVARRVLVDEVCEERNRLRRENAELRQALDKVIAWADGQEAALRGAATDNMRDGDSVASWCCGRQASLAGECSSHLRAALASPSAPAVKRHHDCLMSMLHAARLLVCNGDYAEGLAELDKAILTAPFVPDGVK